MREEAVHASLLHGRIKNKFALAVFVQYGVVVFDGYTAEDLALRCQTIFKDAVVQHVGDRQQDEPRQ